jgi:hypothetical protein
MDLFKEPIDGLPLIIFIGPVILGGLCFLQAYLSKTRKETAGLILPIVSFGLSIMVLTVRGIHDGAVYSFAKFVGGLVVGFISLNLITVLLLIIYFTCRKKMRK